MARPESGSLPPYKGPAPYEVIAQAFHESYERQAPDWGYKTREASAVPWDEVPAANRELMMAVVQDLLDRRIIRLGTHQGDG